MTPSRTLKCSECGKSFEHPIQAGKPPARCLDCRDDSGSVERSKLAYAIRLERANEIREQVTEAEKQSRVLRLAAAMRIFPNDLEAAAGFAGVRVFGPELAELAARARGAFESIVVGDMRDAGKIADAVLTSLLVEVNTRRSELPAKDLTNAGRFALLAREALVGDGPAHTYTAINISVVPPPADGKLTPEQYKKVHGHEPPAE